MQSGGESWVSNLLMQGSLSESGGNLDLPSWTGHELNYISRYQLFEPTLTIIPLMHYILNAYCLLV